MAIRGIQSTKDGKTISHFSGASSPPGGYHIFIAWDDTQVTSVTQMRAVFNEMLRMAASEAAVKP